MLSPIFLTRAFVASGALWCAAGITAGLMRGGENNAQAPRAESALSLLNESEADKSDRLVRDLEPFAERWPVIAIEPAPSERSLRRVVTHRHIARHHDRVCGPKGRRWFTRHGWRYWRCRR